MKHYHHIFKLLPILLTLLFFILIACKNNNSESTLENPEKPNILVLLTDDQRWDAIGFMGNKIIKTPNIDSLAYRGIQFKNAFVTTPICCASRANVLTGQYASRNGVHDFFTPIKLEETYPRLIRENGYYTGFIGKWGTLETDSVYFQKSANLFDFWAGSMGQANYWHERDCNYVLNNGTSDKENFYCNCPPDKRGVFGEGLRIGNYNMESPIHLTTEVIPHKMKQFLDQRPKDAPFCMSISFKSPHAPWSDYDEKYRDYFEGQRMSLEESVNIENALIQPEFLRVSLNGNNMIEQLVTKDSINGKLQSSIREYFRLIKGLDDSVGEIIKELKLRDLFDNTIIIFLSDNGQFMGEHGFHGKWLMYEESIRVPFFILDPRKPKNRPASSDEFVLSIDVAPTILDFAGIEIPIGIQGKSLLPLLYENSSNQFRSEAIFEHEYGHGKDENHIERSRAYRSRDWKYIRYIDRRGPLSEELYHISSDSLELIDLSSTLEYRNVLDSLRTRFEEHFSKIKD